MKVTYNPNNDNFYFKQATDFLAAAGVRNDDNSPVIIDNHNAYAEWLDTLLELDTKNTLVNPKKPLYYFLFEKAAEFLRKSEPSTYSSSFVIQDLATYYSHLGALERLGASPEFFKIPLEEDYFEIDTNTRTITMPKDIGNKKWVIGVQGDHLAEVLWFHVDRYYDDQDLAICFLQEPNANNTNSTIQRGQTYIQWKNGKNAGLDAVRMVRMDENNIWFAWYLRSDGAVNKTDDNILSGPLSLAGDLTFSVRFEYHAEGQKDGPILDSATLFSLNTLTCTCTVLNNLIEKIDEVNNVGDFDNILEDTSDQILRPRFAGIFDSVQGAKATITQDLVEYMDLDPITGKAVMQITAQGSRPDSLSYTWYHDGEIIPGAINSSYDAECVGSYYVVVGNNYDEAVSTKIRLVPSNHCEVPMPGGVNITRHPNPYFYADNTDNEVLTVAVEHLPDKFNRVNVGTIKYLWEYYESTTQTWTSVANTAEYDPVDPGLYRVKVWNTLNKEDSSVVISHESNVQFRPQRPASVTLTYSSNDKTIIADVTMDNNTTNGLYYGWEKALSGSNGMTEWVSEGFIKDNNTYNTSLKGPGKYRCTVYQQVFDSIEDSRSIETVSDFITIN